VTHDFAQVLEIEQQPRFIEVLASERDPHFVIVPVRILALTFVVAQVMARGKRIFYRNFKHDFLERKCRRAGIRAFNYSIAFAGRDADRLRLAERE
jgi:hypothetical protein